MSDIIPFPKDRIVRVNLPDSDIVAESKKRGIIAYAEVIADNIMDEIDDHIEANGLEKTLETDQDLTFLHETVRSVIYRYLGIEHPLHDFISNDVTFVEKKNATDRP